MSKWLDCLVGKYTKRNMSFRLLFISACCDRQSIWVYQSCWLFETLFCFKEMWTRKLIINNRNVSEKAKTDIYDSIGLSCLELTRKCCPWSENNTYLRGSITVRLPSCLFGLDSTDLLMLNDNSLTCLVKSKLSYLLQYRHVEAFKRSQSKSFLRNDKKEW